VLLFFHSRGMFLEVIIKTVFMPDKKQEKAHKGKEDKSVRDDMDLQQDQHYPRPTEKDRQFDNQPEFTERTSGTKDEEVK
jgi:hypothetical protein